MRRDAVRKKASHITSFNVDPDISLAYLHAAHTKFDRYHQSTTHYAMDCTTTNRAPAIPHENHEDHSHYLTPAMAKVSFVKSSLFLQFMGPNS